MDLLLVWYVKKSPANAFIKRMPRKQWSARRKGRANSKRARQGLTPIFQKFWKPVSPRTRKMCASSFNCLFLFCTQIRLVRSVQDVCPRLVQSRTVDRLVWCVCVYAYHTSCIDNLREFLQAKGSHSPFWRPQRNREVINEKNENIFRLFNDEKRIRKDETCAPTRILLCV